MTPWRTNVLQKLVAVLGKFWHRFVDCLDEIFNVGVILALTHIAGHLVSEQNVWRTEIAEG